MKQIFSIICRSCFLEGQVNLNETKLIAAEVYRSYLNLPFSLDDIKHCVNKHYTKLLKNNKNQSKEILNKNKISICMDLYAENYLGFKK